MLTDQLINELIQILNQQYGYDFSGYARHSFRRRMIRFAESSGITESYDLKYRFLNEPRFFASFLEKVTVNTTSMFRDPEFFTELRTQVFPLLATYPVIKIWHAGCATGEEVYTMCILLEEAGLLRRSYIYATDINPANIRAARSGIMPQNYMKEYTRSYHLSGGIREFSDYYTAHYGHAIINRNLLERVVFSRHNLVSEASFNEFNLILCRNVLIYFDRFLQERVIGLFHESLIPGGFLALGDKESLILSGYNNHLIKFPVSGKIYRKQAP